MINKYQNKGQDKTAGEAITGVVRIKDIPKEKYFYLDDGRFLKSLEDLYDTIDSINNNSFKRYMFNNDFAKWMRDVFNDYEVYHKLIWAKSREEYKAILKEIINKRKSLSEKEEKKAKTADVLEDKNAADKKLQNKSSLNNSDGDKKAERDKLLKDTLNADELKEKVRKEQFNHINENELSMIDKDRYEEEKSIFNTTQYSQLVNSADKEYEKKYYSLALNNYEGALKIKPGDKRIIDRVFELKNILSGVNKKKAEKSSLDEMEKKSFAVQIDAYTAKYNVLREEIIGLRKNGKDPYISDLHLMPFKAKLHIAEITREQKDLDVVRNMLITAEKELNDARDEDIIDVKNEIEEGVRLMIEKEMLEKESKGQKT